MIRTLLLPILAAAGVVFAVLTVRSGSQPRPVAAPVSAPAPSPFESRIAGAGIIEASTQNIAIGTPVGGVVARVNVGVGDRVSAGDPLFVIDDRTAVARLAIDRAALAAAEAALARLEAMPRPEEVPPAEARAREARAVLEDLQARLEMWESLTDPRAVSAEELSKRRYAVRVSQAQFDQAQANLALLKAGAWKPDLDVARAQVEAARAQVRASQTELERLTVRAPVDGQVLQVNLRPGEFAQAGALATPLMVLGDTRRLHVRVDIDENDAWRLDPRAPAQASLRGNPALKTPLSFVRVDPYVIPKRSLTGDSTERVDTRVLQVLYAFDPASLPAYVGQQVDVWIQAPPPDAAAAAGRAAADRGSG